jgi:hypothetical protein
MHTFESMIAILLSVLLFLGLYRFVTRILLPILRISSAVRGQMRNMQQQANKQYGNNPQSNAGYQAKQTSPKKGDYIEYEEVH